MDIMLETSDLAKTFGNAQRFQGGGKRTSLACLTVAHLSGAPGSVDRSGP
jgi:hypothetical protein